MTLAHALRLCLFTENQSALIRFTGSIWLILSVKVEALNSALQLLESSPIDQRSLEGKTKHLHSAAGGVWNAFWDSWLPRCPKKTRGVRQLPPRKLVLLKWSCSEECNQNKRKTWWNLDQEKHTRTHTQTHNLLRIGVCVIVVQISSSQPLAESPWGIKPATLSSAGTHETHTQDPLMFCSQWLSYRINNIKGSVHPNQQCRFLLRGSDSGSRWILGSVWGNLCLEIWFY